MKRILLSGTMFLAALSAMNAVEPVKDPATYSPVEGVHFKSLWIYSPNTNNAHPMMNSTFTRGMTYADGKVLLPYREATPTHHHINAFDAETGAFIKSYAYPRADVAAGGEWQFQDLQADDQGNLAVANLTFNIQSGNIYIFRMKKGNYEEFDQLLAYTWGDQGSEKGLRIDYFDVYGDLYGDGYIIAAISGELSGFSNIVLRWDIKGGAVVPGEPKVIEIFDYVPAGVTVGGVGVRVRAVDNESFYMDPFTGHACLYNMDGQKIDGFDTGKAAVDNVAANGVEEFKLGDRLFLAAANHDHNSAVKKPFNSLQMFDITEGMEQAKSLGVFPAAGLGTGSNSGRTVEPAVRKINDNTVDIFFHAMLNGVAAYRLSLNPLSVDAEKMSTMNIHMAGSELVFSEEAAKVDVYAVAGNCVAQYANVNRANLSLVKGIYIVKAMDMAGKTKVQKIVVE